MRARKEGGRRKVGGGFPLRNSKCAVSRVKTSEKKGRGNGFPRPSEEEGGGKMLGIKKMKRKQVRP